MSNSKEFLEKFGSVTFDERPFCDGDAISLCEITYMPLETAVSDSFDDEPVSLTEAYYKTFAYRGYKHSNLGIMITKAPSIRLMQMSESIRYKDVKVHAVKDVYSVTPAIQFKGVTFILPDNTVAVVFEGTDDTIAGWKEDADMLLHKGIPSYEYALKYLNDVAEKYDGGLIILGHSKGGHEALYSAIKCSPEIRKRIKYLYNNDGPGFYSDEIFKTEAFEELKDRYRHFVPYSSLVGMLLCHDDNYKAVDSSKHIGLFQHDMRTWKLDDGNLVTKEDIDFLAKFTDFFFEKLVSSTNESHYAALDNYLTELILSTGQETLTNLAKNAISAIKGIQFAYKEIDPNVKETVKDIAFITGQVLKESIISAKEGTINTAKKVKELVTE